MTEIEPHISCSFAAMVSVILKCDYGMGSSISKFTFQGQGELLMPHHKIVFIQKGCQQYYSFLMVFTNPK